MEDLKSQMRAEAYIREAVVQLLSLKLRSGSTVEALTEFTAKCIDSARRNSIETSFGYGLDIHRLGSVLRSWHTETQFLTEDGTPKPLRLTGRCSLGTLVRLHYPPKFQERVIARLREAKLIKRHNKGGWLPTGRHARISQLSFETLEHLSEGVARYVETVTKNVTAKTSDDVLFERSCKVTRLPERDFSHFRDYVAEQATAFITAIDDWLESRNAAQGSRIKTRTAGVYTFAYVGNVD